MTLTRTIRARRAAVCFVATGLVSALAAGCSSSDDGITLGKDWKGARSFVVVDISGTEAVAGVNPVTRKAEPLVLVPQHDDDDDALAPQLARLSDGQWVLAVPRKDGRPDRFYRLDEGSHKLVEQGDHEALHAILPGRTLVADAKGLGGSQAGSGTGTDVLVKDPKSWSVKRKVHLSGPLLDASSDPKSDTVCLATGSGKDVTIHALELGSGKLTSRPGPKGVNVQGLACSDGTPVAAGVPAAQPDGRKPNTSIAKIAVTDAGVSITADTGRIDDTQAQDGTAAVAVALGERTEIVEVDTRNGKELRRVNLTHTPALRALRNTNTGWLAYTQDAVSVVDAKTGKAQTFSLPGTYIAG